MAAQAEEVKRPSWAKYRSAPVLAHRQCRQRAVALSQHQTLIAQRRHSQLQQALAAREQRQGCEGVRRRAGRDDRRRQAAVFERRSDRGSPTARPAHLRLSWVLPSTARRRQLSGSQCSAPSRTRSARDASSDSSWGSTCAAGAASTPSIPQGCQAPLVAAGAPQPSGCMAEVGQRDSRSPFSTADCGAAPQASWHAPPPPSARSGRSGATRTQLCAHLLCF